MHPRRAIAVAAAAVSVALAACARDEPVALRVLAPDGGDPFAPPHGANTARVTLDDGAGAPLTVPVAADGTFTLEVRPAVPGETSRLRLEALRDGVVLGSGATPPLAWRAFERHVVAVFVQPRDSLVPAPAPAFRTPRADFQLVPLGALGVAALTAAPGQAAEGVPDGYDLTTHALLAYPQPVPAVFDGDTAVLPVRSAFVLLHGGDFGIYTVSAPLDRDATHLAVPAERRALVRGTVVADEAHGGAWVFGGRTPGAGAASSRIDHVTADARFDTALAMQTARDRPAVVELRAGADPASPTWLLVGGQDSGSRAIELFPAPSDGGDALLRTGAMQLDFRSGAAAICVSRAAAQCTRVLLLGGSVPGQGLAAEDALLDGSCALAGGQHCALVVAHGPWLTRRRAFARAALADGGRVLVAGGRDDAGAVYDVETVDVSAVDAPQRGRIVATLPSADPAILALANGSVMIAGGLGADGLPRSEVWFYRY